eukprot:TRINITY_DN6200_c0_g1_i3.p1 TRINITY_DN6200_c0_g1~~TRINITY_DN6200_c0_g1_i3.p1  ORF type:complete len:437 (-),score=90.51 TRINITY_DN6200_c0_g1_i3:446-1756(-)
MVVSPIMAQNGVAMEEASRREYCKRFECVTPEKSSFMLSPTSQLSTAPSTPWQGSLDGSEMLVDLDLSMPSSPFFQRMPSLQSDLGIWAKQQTEEWEDDESDDLVLQSDLGVWAQKVVESADRVCAKEQNKPSCIGCAHLQSDLGSWAQSLVDADEWLELQLPSNIESFLVECDALRPTTKGLAFRRSKHLRDREEVVPGPDWGTVVDGVDEGDGWLKVEDFFLPMAMNGLQVISPQDDLAGALGHHQDAAVDGPAITPEGQVVDLDGRAPLFFSHAKELSSSYTAKLIAKDAARAMKAEEARETVEMNQIAGVPAIDIDGVIHGDVVPASLGSGADRLLAFRRKRRVRCGNFVWLQLHSEIGKVAQSLVEGEPTTLCVDNSNGRVFAFLDLHDPQEKPNRLRRKEACVAADAHSSKDESLGCTLAVDVQGKIHVM